MPYAIMRFEKRKGGPASAIEKHHERKKERYASNPDVDTDRSHLNYGHRHALGYGLHKIGAHGLCIRQSE